MKGPARRQAWSAVLAAVLFFLCGCGVFSSVQKKTAGLVDTFRGDVDACTNTMSVVPFENQVDWLRVDLGASFSGRIKTVVEENTRRLSVLTAAQPEFPEQFQRAPGTPDGRTDNFALAVAGRAAGVNMVLTGQLVGARYVEQKEGALWFKETHHVLRLQLEAAVYHTGTGAKLFDEDVFYDVAVSGEDSGTIGEKRLPETVSMPDAAAGMAETLGAMLHETLKDIPWEGYVTTVQADRYSLPFGKQNGLSVGMRLDAFAVADITEGMDTQRYLVPGPKCGTLVLTAVNDGGSEARLADGGPVSPGSLVRLAR